MVAAENDRDRACRHRVSDRALDLRMRSLGVRRHHCRVSEVHDPEHFERVDLRLEVRSRWAARCPDRARAEARPGPIGDEVVRRRSDDGDVHAGELGRILRVRHSRVGEEPRVVGLVREAELAPALERIDHSAATLIDEPGTVAGG